MKHNFKKILCVLLACLMVIPFYTEFAKLPQILAASSDIVDIPDVNMKAALNSALNVEDSSADITKEQLESLTALKLTGSDDTHITDYTGLEYCVNLKTLRITDSELTVLPDITALTKLHFLDLSDCYNLTDISKIPVTDTLNDVELEKCTSVNDISPLKAVPSITRLCLDGVKITDKNADSNADTISSLTNLKYLDLAYAYVTDEYSSMFDSLTKLETLILAYNRFSNVDFLLSHNGTLKELTLYGCPVANDMTDTLGQMTSLKTLGISSTNIMDYRFMSRLPHLTNWPIRMAEGSDSFPTRPYTKIVKEFLPYTQETCVIDNPVINIDGTPVAPVEADGYTFDASSNQIILDTTLVDSGSRLYYYINYHFTITTPAGYDIVMHPLVTVYVSKTSAPDPIKLFTQPKSFKGITGSSYSLNVAVQGTGGSNKYQWYKDGTALTGETSSTLNFSALAESDAGDYTVVVSNGVSSVTSDTATVTVMPRLQISAQPASLSLTEGESGELSVTASGYGTLSYQWFKNGSAITNATASSIRFDNISGNDAGSYYVVVYDDNSSTMSSAANITVTTKPTQPVTKPTETATTEAATTQPVTKPTETATTEAATTQPVTKPTENATTEAATTQPVTKPTENATTEAATTQPATKPAENATTEAATTQPVTKPAQPATTAAVQPATSTKTTTATKTAAASTDTATQNNTQEPATGDTTSVAVYGLLLFAAVLGCVTLLITNKKKMDK